MTAVRGRCGNPKTMSALATSGDQPNPSSDLAEHGKARPSRRGWVPPHCLIMQTLAAVETTGQLPREQMPGELTPQPVPEREVSPETGSQAPPRSTRPPEWVVEYSRGRRYPRRTQFDYLHLRRLLSCLEYVLTTLPHPVHDVVDIFCGTRPYDDLLPTGARCVGLDIDERYGGADVVTTEFLPFEDASFDLAMCIQGFQYIEDPGHGVTEIARVLRPGGTALVTTPLVGQYNPDILEHRYTGPELKALFADWDDVRIFDNGGRGISWALLTGSIIELREAALPAPVRRAVWPLFSAAYLAVNSIGALIERGDERRPDGAEILPVNLMLVARRPTDGSSHPRPWR